MSVRLELKMRLQVLNSFIVLSNTAGAHEKSSSLRFSAKLSWLISRSQLFVLRSVTLQPTSYAENAAEWSGSARECCLLLEGVLQAGKIHGRKVKLSFSNILKKQAIELRKE